MMDGRRHSVDIPISRTLLALRRVRSLRDPSTNSMSKFSSLLDNVKWETDSTRGISLRFEGDCKEGSLGLNGLFGSRTLGLKDCREEPADDLELQCGLRSSKLRTSENLNLGEITGAPTAIEQVEGFHENPSNQNEFLGDELHKEKYCSSSMEDVGSCRGPIVGSPSMEEMDHSVLKQKPWHENQVKFFEEGRDITSCLNSTYPSANQALSSCSTSLFADEEIDNFDCNYQGCGMNYCWSRTPRAKEEDHPLLSRDVGGTITYENRQRRGNYNEITTYSETPRSLSQKFRPKCFDELVGQNVVVRSLVNAVSKGMVTSFYLFHGPRGTGKTSASRIFAAALNCLSIEESKPCGMCRECIMFFSGRSRDIKEVDSVRINRTDKLRYLIKNASVPPSTSRFKIFIIDECQLLHTETWASFLNGLVNISQHVIFIMITPDLDKLPRSAVSRFLKYHFPKIKDADIARKLGKICAQEALYFDQVALELIAEKSNGSLRDAEMMLDQLSLLGKKITLPLARELIGIVSDDELLDLLDVALSSDTSKTVIRAREIMRSKIDPMQLISQLANLIMDILAGTCQEATSEARRKFFGTHTSEADMQKLSQALKILSETERQLRMSKHQTTWLTVALLQLSSVESCSLDLTDSKLCLENARYKDDDSLSRSSPGETLNHLVSCSCDCNLVHKLGAKEDCKGTLELVWKRAIEICQSNSLKNLLRKQGKLASLHVSQGLAVAELLFNHPNYVSKAEKSWKLIASSLQLILGCNVEIRLLCSPTSNCTNIKKPSFSWFSCSRRMQQKRQSTTERGSDSDCDHVSEKPMMDNRHSFTFSSDCGSQMSNQCYLGTEVISALKNSDGNVLSIRTTSRNNSTQCKLKTPGYGFDTSKEGGNNCNNQDSHEPENQPRCFPRTLSLRKKSCTPESNICTTNEQDKQLALSISRRTALGTYIINDPFVFYGTSDNYSNSLRGDNGLEQNSYVLCWRTPTFPLKKAWQLRHEGRRSNFVDCILPCATAK